MAEYWPDMQTKDQLNNSDQSTLKLIDTILNSAISKQASDVHFESYQTRGRVRLRIDGLLYEEQNINRALWPKIVTCLKIMANLNIAEKRLPQDGRFTLKLDQYKQYDCRLSSCPTAFGEKIVIRVLNPSSFIPQINQLGFDEESVKIFEQQIKSPQGIILVTGPTGSGKTVTLYSAINYLNQTTKNISAAEDPIEIYLEGINQIETNHKIGLDFTTVLRAFLRQDPDIIMIGEIRDLETAKIAVNAAHTGHLVLATLHTNSTAATLTRLLNMGIPPFSLASALKLIVAQRLVRKLCPKCKIPQKPPSQILLSNRLSADTIIFSAHGCQDCNYGYLGRTAIFEVLAINQEIAHLIMQENNIISIESRLQQLSYPKLREVALKKVWDGTTSLEEIDRIIN